MIYPDLDKLTHSERLAFAALAEAANLVLHLRPVHVSEHSESARDFHDLQCRLLARVAYDEAERLSSADTYPHDQLRLAVHAEHGVAV